jgi:hypothetical protein
MKYLIGFVIWMVVLAATPMAARHFGPAAVDEVQPVNLRIDHDIMEENQPLLWILQDMLRGTRVPAGFAELTGCSDLPRAYLKVRQGTSVPVAMNALVADKPSYEWWMEGGTVNLIPRGGVPLLGTKIGNFQMGATERGIGAILQDLLGLPEVRERAAKLGLKPGIHQGGISAVELHPVPREPVPIHISVQNVSLRDAFNKVVRMSGHAIWIYHETECNGNKTYVVDSVTSD